MVGKGIWLLTGWILFGIGWISFAEETGPIFSPITARADQFSLTVQDSGAIVIDPISVQLTLDGVSVIPMITKFGATLTVTYNIFQNEGRYFESGSTHTVQITVASYDGQPFTHQDEFTVPVYQVIPPEWALSEASERGMNVRISRIEVPREAQTVAWAEQQLAGGILNPDTSQPYPNLMHPSTYTVDTVNWVSVRKGSVMYPYDIDDSPVDGPDHFNTLLPLSGSIPNDPIPGTENLEADEVKNLVAEVTCYLYLQPGYYRMGVNSDDGFRVSVAPGQPNVLGLTLGEFNGSRAAADTTFDFVVSKEGYYPFRLLWWQGDGPASCEWYTIDLNSGEYLLINGPQIGAIPAYRTSSQNRVHVTKMLPAPGLPHVLGGQTFTWEIVDGAAPLVPDSLQLIWNGIEQTNLIVQKSGTTTTVRWTLPLDAVPSNQIQDITGALVFADQDGFVQTNQFQFRLIGWVRPWLKPEPEDPEFAIGLNFGADEPNGTNAGQVPEAQWAGVIPQRHWNNLTGPQGYQENLIASVAGVATNTTLTVEWESHNTWASTGRGMDNNHFPTNTADHALMTGYLDTPTDGTTTVILRNLPEAMVTGGYDLYIYAMGDGAGRGGAYQIEDLNGKVLAGPIPFVSSEGNYGYFECPSKEDFSIPGNYLVFRNLHASDLVIVATTEGEWPGLDRAPINAIQIVKRKATVPPQILQFGWTEEGKLVIEWVGGILQQAETITGPWQDVPGATSPYIVDPSSPAKFFRVKGSGEVVPAPTIRIRIQDDKLVLEWDGVATLQTADSITGPWQDVPNATSPYLVDPNAKKKFFRLKR